MSLWRIDVATWVSDEFVYAHAGVNYWQGNYRYNSEHPPLGKLLIGTSEHFFGESLWAVRLPTAVLTLLGGLLLWWWLSRGIGPAAGRTAAVLWWTLPGMTSFPELLGHGVLGSGPSLELPQRWATLDPLAGVIALGALAAGWWWVRTGRLAAALACGLLAGAAVATKIPALLIVAVPGVIGPLATLAKPGPWWVAHLPAHASWPRSARIGYAVLGRLPRAVGHGATWLAGGFAAFVIAYAPMGAKQGIDSFEQGWLQQRTNGTRGHIVLVHGTVYKHAPWWALAWWQWATLGAAIAVIALAAMAAGMALRSGLTAYLTAAWLVPLLFLVPASGLALPHYIIIWRGPLIGAAVAGGAVAVRALSRARVPRLTGRAVAAALLVVALLPPAVFAARTTVHLARLRPSGYGALPGLAGPGEVQVVGDGTVSRYYLPHNPVVGVRNAPRAHRPAPGTIVVDSSITSRSGTDYGLSNWARLHHYRLVHTGTLDIYLRPK